MRRLSISPKFKQLVVRSVVVVLGVLAFASVSARINLSARGDVHAPAMAPQDAQCVSIVPKTWGQYRGGSAQSGLSFEDSNGTLRFVTNLPCGSVPTVALEIRRSGNYN
jgi:hypothetical protein